MNETNQTQTMWKKRSRFPIIQVGNSWTIIRLEDGKRVLEGISGGYRNAANLRETNSQESNTMNETKKAVDKRKLYTTATALLSCAKFKSGEVVSVKYDCQNWKGVHYFTCNDCVEYPEHHLTRFVI